MAANDLEAIFIDNPDNVAGFVFDTLFTTGFAIVDQIQSASLSLNYRFIKDMIVTGRRKRVSVWMIPRAAPLRVGRRAV